MKINRRAGIALLILIASLGAISYLAARNPSSVKANPEIIHANLGGSDLYIPRAYVKFRNTSIGTESALIQAWYPGSAIVPGDSPNELWKQGEWWKNVRILISQRHNAISFSEFSRKSNDYLDATVMVGNENGLIHYTQPNDKNKDNYDVWLERDGEMILSDVTCTEKIIESDVPQCSHNVFIGDKFWLKISYDRRLLPEWKLIKTSAEAMFESFRTEESARVFVLTRMREIHNEEFTSNSNNN